MTAERERARSSRVLTASASGNQESRGRKAKRLILARRGTQLAAGVTRRRGIAAGRSRGAGQLNSCPSAAKFVIRALQYHRGPILCGRSRQSGIAQLKAGRGAMERGLGGSCRRCSCLREKATKRARQGDRLSFSVFAAGWGWLILENAPAGRFMMWLGPGGKFGAGLLDHGVSFRVRGPGVSFGCFAAISLSVGWWLRRRGKIVPYETQRLDWPAATAFHGVFAAPMAELLSGRQRLGLLVFRRTPRHPIQGARLRVESVDAQF